MIDRIEPQRPRSSRNQICIAIAAIFLAAVAAAVGFNLLPRWVLVVYLLASLGSFIAYANDKYAAKRNRWRTPESTLHLLDLLGGWPGAILAQQLFRHKTKKLPFRIVFWLTVVVNSSVLVWLILASREQMTDGTLPTQILTRRPI